MIVTIDATSALLRSAGIKSYTYYWVRELRRLARGDEIRAFPYLNDFGKLDHEASTLSKWQTLPRLALLYAARGSRVLDWTLRRSDVFHASNQVRRAPRGVKLTATIHDLTCWLMPQFHTEGNIRADRSFADQILKRADGLIAVSENTRQDAIRLLGIAPERIQTIYSGVADEYFAAQPTRRKKPYALYVGTIEPRKNLDALLDAWRQLNAEVRETYELVIAGPRGWGSETTFARIGSEATYLGYVPEADLPGLVAGASVFVYPSLYEGFGFPVVQAMAAGVAVLTSNTSCLPEVTGDGALLVDPGSVSEISEGLARLLESDSLRAKIGSRGREKAKQFRWETCAAQSLEFFHHVAG
ncbi:MAG TPA: glycosyltransferase family 1 protein [Bryobacteraceae bacterium]|nr:glycosyltransferase family 1 protein [Bryobacteraceae bacterium]